MPQDPTRILVFVGTKGVHHDHLGQGTFLTELLNQDPQIQADLSRDYHIMAESLHHYDAPLFFTDQGNLTPKQEQGLLTFIEQGGGFFGLHTAAASFPHNQGYHRMLNGLFDGHSPYMDFTVNITDATHPITHGLTDFTVTDELYYLKHDPTRSHTIMESHDPTRNETHPMAYHHTHGQGRVFFFALGHQAALDNPTFQEVIRRGTLWVSKREPRASTA